MAPVGEVTLWQDHEFACVIVPLRSHRFVLQIRKGGSVVATELHDSIEGASRAAEQLWATFIEPFRDLPPR
jgi:hypothetical protein